MRTLGRCVSLLVAIVAPLAFGGCESYEAYAARRTDGLRQFFPPNVTTRDDVRAKMAPIKPDWTELRPEGGWAQHKNQYLAKTIPLIEGRTGREIARMDRYSRPDGLVSLCFCWFYFDSTDLMVDVEWMYQSD